MKFQRSEELFERAQRRISGGVNSPSRSYAAVGGGAPALSPTGKAPTFTTWTATVTSTTWPPTAP